MATGLDVATWKQALADRVHQPWVDANLRAARALGISRTGFVAINGRTAPKDAAAIVTMVEQERDATAALGAELCDLRLREDRVVGLRELAFGVE